MNRESEIPWNFSGIFAATIPMASLELEEEKHHRRPFRWS
jgi:hypothetical protein